MKRAHFAEARELLAKYLPQTRLVRARSLEKTPEQKVYLKLESELPTHSFKARGAIYALSAWAGGLAMACLLQHSGPTPGPYCRL